MKKAFKYYFAVWAILFIAFNALCFATPNEIGGFTKIDATFWVSYAFITAAFIGALVCAYFAFKAENANKMFLNLPLITVSYTGLVLMLIFGGICMVVPNLPSFIGAIVCIIILLFTAISVIKSAGAAEAVTKVEEKVKTKTAFIKSLTVDAEGVLARAKSDAVKAECKKVYEAVRYSDPMSSEELSVIEAKMTVALDELKTAVSADDAEKAKAAADELVILVGERNAKCKLLK